MGDHVRTARERQFEIGKRERAVGRRYEILAPHREEEIENILVEDLPWADLLLDHVEARLFKIHGDWCHQWHRGNFSHKEAQRRRKKLENRQCLRPPAETDDPLSPPGAND